MQLEDKTWQMIQKNALKCSLQIEAQCYPVTREKPQFHETEFLRI